MKFEDLGLSPALLRAIGEQGYTTATPIQAAAIPPVLQGRDVLGCAQTGTGKTAAFALPTLMRLSQADGNAKPKGRRPIRALILSPTRELALQIAENFNSYGRHTGLRNAVVFGGVSQNAQVRALKSGVDVLIATPGRLLDLKQQGFVDLTQVEVLVLDEADRMLDMGFLPDLKRIVQQIPPSRQTLLFSATMPTTLQKVVDGWLKNPVEVKVARVSSTAAKIDQSVMYIDQARKLFVLTNWLHQTAWSRALVFSRTKHGADKIVRHLTKNGIPSEAFHSNKSQNARQRTLKRFQSQPLVLVATDIAARGLDIDDISHVVNYDLPMDAESYVHRIGRTGRAGSTGTALSLCSPQERRTLQAIQRLTRKPLAVQELPAMVDMPPAARAYAEKAAKEAEAAQQQNGRARKPGFGKSKFGKSGAGKSSSGKPAFGKPAYAKAGGSATEGGKRPYGKPRRRKPATQRQA